MRIKFLKDYGLKDGQGAGPHYQVGQEQTFTDHVGIGYAYAYIERGVAVEVKVSPPAAPEPASVHREPPLPEPPVAAKKPPPFAKPAEAKKAETVKT